MSTSEQVLRVRQDELSWRAVEGGVIILDMRRSLYLSLNGSAATLWQQLDRGCSEADLNAALVEEFQIPPERAREDVTSFLRQCREVELIEVGGPGN